MAHTFPELRKMRRGDTASFGRDEAGELEWLVLDNRGGRLLLLCKRALKGDWLKQHGNPLLYAELNRIIAEKWLSEWFDWIEIEMVVENPEQKFLLCEAGIRPFVEIDLSRMEYHPKKENNSITADTVEMLIRYGMNERMARMLVRGNVLPVQLNIPGETDNLELLARHMDLNSERCKTGIRAFLMRDHSVNQRLEVIPEWFSFPEKDAQEYLSHPLDWGRDIYEWYNCEEALKLITKDDALIHEILVHMFTYGAYVSSDVFRAICLKLSWINTDQAQMDALLRDCFDVLFSAYSYTKPCIDLLVKVMGLENALATLARHPTLPRRIMSEDWNAFRDITPAEFEDMFS